MYRSTKIATCCYCGTRATLVLTGDRHELSCAGCGAPLHNLKRLRSDVVAAAAQAQPGAGKPHKSRPLLQPGLAGTAAGGGQGNRPCARKSDSRKRKKPARKGFARKFLEEAFDVIEDIFD
jgi:hypothetical protein